MKDLLPTVITLKGVKRIRLIAVCAWCPKEGYPKLHPHEEYTHGICDHHLHQELGQYRERKRA